MARKSWLDEKAESTKIDDYAKQLGTFVEAMADGRIDQGELSSQEKRVVQLMKEIEPQLDDTLHEKVTDLLCELSAFNCMQLLHSMMEERPKVQFRG
jgi:hypothetical protein